MTFAGHVDRGIAGNDQVEAADGKYFRTIGCRAAMAKHLLHLGATGAIISTRNPALLM